MTSIKTKANVYLLLALILGSLLPIMLDLAKNIGTSEFLFFGYLISVPVSLAFVFLTKKQERLLSYLRNYKNLFWIAFIGLLNFATLEYGIAFAERFVSASIATVVYRSYPLLMLAFIPIILKEKVSKYQIIALGLGFIGLYIALSGGNLFIIANKNTVVIGLLILVAIASAISNLLIKRFTFDMESAMFIFSVANAIFFGLMFLTSHNSISQFSYVNIISLLYVGIIYNVFVGFMYYGALRMFKTTFVTNVYFLSPFLTFIFASIILAEKIQLYYIAIAILVSIGILIQKFDKKGGTYRARKYTGDSTFVLFDVTGAFSNASSNEIHKIVKSGGRILAIKIDNSNVDRVLKLINSNRKRTKKILLTYFDTDTKLVNYEESKFVNDVLGKTENERVLMSAGDTDESEKFFSFLESKLEDKSN